jgi:hypothetical protein
MHLQEALALKKRIITILFSRTKKPVFAGGWDEDDSIEETVYDVFDSVFGVSIAGSEDRGFFIELLSDEDALYLTPVRRFFKSKAAEIVHVRTSPFKLRMRHRPLQIGCSVSHRLNYDKGTLGCFVVNEDDGLPYILSNHHVLYSPVDEHDNFIVQPCTYEGGNSADAIGLYSKSLSFNKSDINYYDAAIAGPISVDIDPEIPGVCKGIKHTRKAENERLVYKIGAQSGRTFGKITSFISGIKVNINGERYDFDDQIRIEGFKEDFETPDIFSEPGDSGSLIIDYETNEAVGLLFAGNKQGITLANPIEPVLRKLGVRF